MIFLLLVFALFEILLVWFPILQIRSHIAFFVLGYVLLAFVFFALLGYVIYLTIKFPITISWNNFLQANKFSFLISGLMIIPLIVLIILPQLAFFSDTQAYIQISSFFLNDASTFSIGGSDILNATYRLPVGYYMNAVISILPKFVSVAYYYLWTSVIFYLFGWFLQYVVEEKLAHLKLKYRLWSISFVFLVFCALAFIVVYTFTGGNIEIQSLFILVALSLLITKNGRYLWILPFSFLFFSTTAGLLSPGVILIGIVYTIVKGTWKQLSLFLVSAIGLFLLGVSGFLSNSDGNPLISYAAVGSTVFLVVTIPLIILISKKFARFNCLILPTEGLFKARIKTQLAFKKIFGTYKLKQIWLLSIFSIFGIFASFITYFSISKLSSIAEPFAYVNIIFVGLLLFYGIYSSVKLRVNNEFIYWITWFLIAFAVVSSLYTIAHLFANNASAWRTTYLSPFMGNLSVYIGMIFLIVVHIYLDHETKIIKWLRYGKKNLSFSPRRRGRLILISSSLNFAVVGIATAVTIGFWVTRNEIIGSDGVTSPVVSQFAPEDQAFLQALNNQGVASRLKNANEDQNIPLTTKSHLLDTNFYYYSDLSLVQFLNNGAPFSQGASWEANFSNVGDFVLNDRRMHTIQSQPINQLIYYYFKNAVNNINFIINQAIKNVATDAIIPKQANDKNSHPGVMVAKSNESADSNLVDSSSDAPLTDASKNPVLTDQIDVIGAPDLIILNKKSSYYKDLDLVKKMNLVTGVYAPDPSIDQSGYQLFYQTSDIAYFKNLGLSNLDFSKINISVSRN